MKYFYSKRMMTSFEEALLRTAEELKKEGFGVVTKIDIKKILKEKLNIDFENYIIFGACNPSFAYKSLQKEPKAGLMLPCKVVVHEVAEGEIEIAVLDPVVAIGPIGNNQLSSLAEEVRDKLIRVINRL